MKIREGFVSNSSSSSFVVAVDKPINTIEDVKKYIINPKYAEIFFGGILHQEGVYICSIKEDCETCRNRFRCFTGSSAKLLEALLDFWEENNEENREHYRDYYGTKFSLFENDNHGKVAYFITLSDQGSKTETSMLDNVEEVFEKISYICITP